MTCRRSCALALVVCCLAGLPSVARASVDLELRPPTVSSSPGEVLDVGLYAVADGGVSETISAMDVVLTWDPSVVQLEQAINTGLQSWVIFGFMADSQLDGLNDSLADGDALLQAASFAGVSVSPAGTLVATLRFRSLMPGKTTLAVDPGLGNFLPTRVLAAFVVNVNVTGLLGTAELDVTGATLSVVDLTLPAGRTAPLIVSGAANAEVFGVTALIQIVPRAGDTGVTRFTAASGPADVDIFQLNDPWPDSGGAFQAFDTNTEGILSDAFNGAALDNGTFMIEPTVFSGPLMSFGVDAMSDARGVWDVVFDEGAARWESPIFLPIGFVAGTITVVAAGDGDGSETIELGDFSELAACFTGDLGPIDPPAYSTDAGSRCAVYDFDNDGDVDESDYAVFSDLLSGP